MECGQHKGPAKNPRGENADGRELLGTAGVDDVTTGIIHGKPRCDSPSAGRLPVVRLSVTPHSVLTDPPPAVFAPIVKLAVFNANDNNRKFKNADSIGYSNSRQE